MMKTITFSMLAAVLLAQACRVGAANAEVVVVVSAKSVVGTLTKDQISNIFLGNSLRFPSGEQAIPIDLAEETGQFSQFHSVVTGMTVATLRGHWSKMVFSGRARPPREVSNQNEAIKLIASNPNVIGYIDKSLVDTSIKVVFQR